MNYNSALRRQWRATTGAMIGAMIGAAIGGLLLWSGVPSARASESAVAVMYHRFGEDAHPSTNIRIDQFEAHIQELTEGDYTVLPLEKIVDLLSSGERLPDRAVAITVDDAYRSVYAEAWPRLRKAGLPFTLFVATETVEKGLPAFMTWDQIRELRDDGVTIGAHGHSHGHLPRESLDAIRADIDRSNAIYKRELGAVPVLFAYPFGETSADIIKLVRKSGYRAAFGQHSGVMARTLSAFYLPRFALNETYGSLDRLKLAANALPIPVTGVTPTDPLVTDAMNPPAFGFTVDETVGSLKRLACYHSHSGKAMVQRLGTRRVEVRFPEAFPKGRSRVNCTMPAEQGRWRWLGMQFYVKP